MPNKLQSSKQRAAPSSGLLSTQRNAGARKMRDFYATRPLQLIFPHHRLEDDIETCSEGIRPQQGGLSSLSWWSPPGRRWRGRGGRPGRWSSSGRDSSWKSRRRSWWRRSRRSWRRRPRNLFTCGVFAETETRERREVNWKSRRMANLG